MSMIMMSLTAGIITTAGLVFLAAKFGKEFVLKLLGYDWAVDLIFTIGVAWLFAISGTISGMLTGVMTGLLVSVLLIIAKKALGYMRLTRNDSGKLVWTTHRGEWASKLDQIFAD